MANGAEKGNEYAVEALKQVLTLAGGILALTITFLKDALGDAWEVARLKFLIRLAWVLLIIVVWTAWIALAEAAKKLGTSQTDSPPYVFDKGYLARTLARVAQFSFAAALTCFGIFAVVNFDLYFQAKSYSEERQGSATHR